ncbi:uncharacterized protein LOC120207397 [Hibiscus syriacus]|uniref:uncharacterized protein LOC120207397 n=1 Tax=Hibiscus syriacus TaxID=106335 RepID=UPI00192268FD|nr:uncharacterized protein LOC120207397 [Hibiscus syriacus]
MYPYLKIDEWTVFVSQRLSKKWEEISEKAKKMRGQHRYNHRLSRKGYAGLTLEIMQETGKEEDEIDRALLWKKARQMKKEVMTRMFRLLLIKWKRFRSQKL